MIVLVNTIPSIFFVHVVHAGSCDRSRSSILVHRLNGRVFRQFGRKIGDASSLILSEREKRKEEKGGEMEAG